MADNTNESDVELFASPARKPAKEPDRPKTPSNQTNRFDDDTDDARDAALQRELHGVKSINGLIEGVVGTLERARGNMEVGYGSSGLVALPRIRQC